MYFNKNNKFYHGIMFHHFHDNGIHTKGQGSIDKDDFKVIAKSDPIPNPPLAMSIKLPDLVKIAIKNEVANLHNNPNIKEGMLRGYGGKKVDYYDTNISDADMLPALKKMALIDNNFKLSIIEANNK